jgi:HAD superfamily hydrolase (TIGR01509 family)
MKTGVLFDCDGVLINTEELGYAVLSEMLAEYDITYSREEFTELVSGVEQNRMLEMVRSDFKAQKGYDLPADFGQKLWERWRQVSLEDAVVIEGIRELLDNLRAHNIPFAVCSNSDATSLMLKLRATGLYDDFMPNIYSKDHVENPKPAPDMYLEGARLIGVNIKDCFVVEDSRTGTKAGVAAGATVIGFVGEQHRGDHEAEELLDAGATMIALTPAEIWGHIADRLNLTNTPPAPAPKGSTPS